MIHWYALQTKPHKEDFLCKELAVRKIEYYFPYIHVKRVNQRARPYQPLFPGYLFIYVDFKLNQELDFRWVPGSIGLVTFGDEPAYIPDNLINNIREKTDEINLKSVSSSYGYEPGDLLEIVDGPLKGYEAIFDISLSGSERVRVMLKLLRAKQTAVELPVEQVKRKNGLA